jgi:predicted phage terminase large subunit-like protein
MNLTSEDLLNVERELCRRSLAEFAKRAWSVLEPAAVLKWGWALDAICEHLEAVTDGDITRLLMNVPPGSMKSLLTGVIWPAWEWGPRGMPEMRFVGTAHEETLAIRDSRKCRDLIKSDWYQRLWAVELSRDLDGKREFGNSKKGVRQARSFTSLTGVRGDRVILDDPISADNANSDAKLEAARVAFLETLPTRVNSDKSAIVVIMQRLNEKDVSGVILEKKLPYVHLCIPMRFESDRACTTAIGWSDPRRVDGELMFPERFSEEQVSELEATLGEYGTAGQLQQRPAPRGGGMFKRHDFNMIEAAPACKRIMRGWDLAATAKEDAAATAGVLMGEKADGSGFVVLDAVREQVEPAGTRRLIKSTAAHDGKTVYGSLPKDPGQAGKAQAQDLIAMLAGYPYEATPESGDKITRAEPFAAQVSVGNVDIVRGPWNEAFLSEVEVFPFGKWKDQVDAASRAFNELLMKPVYRSAKVQIRL